MIPKFQNKLFNTLNLEEKIAFIECVCMEEAEYLRQLETKTPGSKLIDYWQHHILKKTSVNSSDHLSRYYYKSKEGFGILDDAGTFLSLKHFLPEVVLFVNNCVLSIPIQSPIVEMLNEGKTAEYIKNKGVKRTAYPDEFHMPGIRRKGKPVNENSLRQRILRGEITRWEAYQKKSVKTEDDAL